jgi:hypothetical protein
MTPTDVTTLTPVAGVAFCTAHNDVTHGTLTVCLSADGSPRPCVIVPLFHGAVERVERVRIDDLRGVLPALERLRVLVEGALKDEGGL